MTGVRSTTCAGLLATVEEVRRSVGSEAKSFVHLNLAVRRDRDTHLPEDQEDVKMSSSKYHILIPHPSSWMCIFQRDRPRMFFVSAHRFASRALQEVTESSERQQLLDLARHLQSRLPASTEPSEVTEVLRVSRRKDRFGYVFFS